MLPRRTPLLVVAAVAASLSALAYSYPTDQNETNDVSRGLQRRVPVLPDGLRTGETPPLDRQSLTLGLPSSSSETVSNEIISNDFTIDIPCSANDYQYNDPRPQCKAMRARIWEQLGLVDAIMLITSILSIGGEAGLGAFYFHDPVLSFEGLLTFAFVIAHCALIGTKVYLTQNAPWTWDPYAVVDLLEQTTVMAISIVIFFQMILSILFNLDDGQDAVHLINDVGWAAVVHAGFGGIHVLQGVIIGWRRLQEWTMKTYFLSLALAKGKNLFRKGNKAEADDYLDNKGWIPQTGRIPVDPSLKDAVQQKRDVLKCLGEIDKDSAKDVNLNTCTQMSRERLAPIVDLKQGHTHGLTAILADVFMHTHVVVILGVSGILEATGRRISGHAVSWTVNMITLATLLAIMFKTSVSAFRAFPELAVKLTPATRTTLEERIEANILSESVISVKYRAFQLPAETYDIRYISFFVEVDRKEWSTFFKPQRNGVSRKDVIESKLREMAVDLRLYDGTKLNREFSDDERPTYVTFMPVTVAAPDSRMSARAEDVPRFSELEDMTNDQFLAVSTQLLMPLQEITALFDEDLKEEIQKYKVTTSALQEPAFEEEGFAE